MAIHFILGGGLAKQGLNDPQVRSPAHLDPCDHSRGAIDSASIVPSSRTNIRRVRL